MELYNLLIAFLISFLCRLISHSYRCFLEYCFAKLERVWMIDRISGLPDSLIQHILSFLPTKDAARTCILSTRWKDTWIGTPTIDVELHRLFKTNSTETYKENFINFMDRLILLHEGYNIDKINFAYSTSFDSARVTSWVSTLLMQHKVKDLHIHESLSEIPFLMGISMPISIFTNESLTRLRIRIDSIVQIPISLCMSNLRDLDLNRIVFSCEHLTQQVLFSFPNLESFIIISCHWKNTQAVRICAPRLKVLFILDRTWDECCEVNIDAPSLMSFRFGSLEYNLPNLSSLVPKYSLSNLSSLDNATIDVLFQPSASDYAIKFFRDISSIKNLSVSGGTITTLCDAINSFHQLTLSNVTILNVAYIATRNMSSQDFGRNRLSSQDFIKFVHMLPNLESLGFPRGVGEFCKEEDYGVLEVTLPSSLSKLKAIGVLFFEGNDLEVFLIELFLKNAMVLERMTILPSRKLLENGWNHMKSRLLQVPRAHGSCRIYTS